mgnify:CR=1 FL=1
MAKKRELTKEEKIKNYKASSIEALTPLAHLRTRLNLTFGEERGDEDYPYSSQKNVAIREIWDNSLGEVAIGVANRLRVTFYKDGVVKIEDNGRGIPTDISEDGKIHIDTNIVSECIQKKIVKKFVLFKIGTMDYL